jgi:uncharacterized membrane protein
MALVSQAWNPFESSAVLAEFGIPTLPPWEGMHPVVVHLPIGVLMIVPVFIGLSMLCKQWARPVSLIVFLLALVGTSGAMLAVMTGEATEKFAEGVPGADGILDRHEEAAELARNIFIGVTVLSLAVFALAGKLIRTTPQPGATATTRRGGWIVANLVLLGATLAGCLVLANTGHLGGQLVHGLGVRAPLLASDVPAGSPAPAGSNTQGTSEKEAKDAD